MRNLRFIKYITLVVILLTITETWAQDPIYSQYYVTPNMVNPAFVGNTYGPYISFQNRDQWLQADKPYRTFTGSFSKRLNQRHGLGFLVTSDHAFNSALLSTKIAGQYSLRVKLDKHSYIRGGVELGFVTQRLNVGKLIFYDNLDPITGVFSSGGTLIPTNENLTNYRNQYLDLGTGVLYNNTDYYVGFSMQHINRPTVDFVAGSNSQKKAILYSLQGGYELDFKYKNYNNVYLSPTFIANKQGASWRVQLGAIQNVENFYVGTWLRYATRNIDAFILGFGVKQNLWKLSYTFDYPLTAISFNRGVTHELGLSLNFEENRRQPIYDDCFQIFR